MKAKKKVRKGRRIATTRTVADEGPSSESWRQMFKPIKQPVTIRLDADVIAWFRKQGRGYQTRMNNALRKAMMDQQKKSGH